MIKNEIYFSVDIEADGPIPGEYSMLSLGAAAFNQRGKLLDTFSVNLDFLDGAKQDEDTMNWWSKNQEAWENCRIGTIDPKVAMVEFTKWVNDISKDNNSRPVFVGYPAGFDFLFVYWYLIKFVGESPFSFSALDIKTYAMSVLKCKFRESTKRNFPKRWFSKKKHTHVAVDDAIEQGEMFMNILRENVKG